MRSARIASQFAASVPDIHAIRRGWRADQQSRWSSPNGPNGARIGWRHVGAAARLQTL